MPTATRIQDLRLGFFSRIESAGGNPVGEHYYRVDTDDVEDALDTVIAAQPVGTAWSAGYASALASSHVPVRLDPGYTYIVVRYTALNLSGSIDRTATSTTAFHKPIGGSAQVEIYNDISGSPIPRTTIDTDRDQLVVVGYRTGAQYLTARSHWYSIRRKRNSNTVAIPGLVNVSGSGFTAVANELRAVSMSSPETVQENLVRIEYTFDFGPAGTHAYTYREVDEDGAATGSPVTAQVYEAATFTVSNLWG